MTRIRVSETFYSIQGEGPTVGVPAVFIRLQGCNLNCGSQSGSWVCDTVDVWKKGTQYSIADFFQDIMEKYNHAFLAGAHLVMTGGEPLLQQAAMSEFINQFNQKPYIEVETNGTIAPNDALIPLIDQWNVSPKLTNSGEPVDKRINTTSLEWFSMQPNSVFKFVVANTDDIDEINTSFPWVCALPIRQKYIMPAADSRELLHNQYATIIEQSKAYGYSLSQRFHLSVWDQKTGI